MTAEIAILNKTAVALAADSAVTISSGLKTEKIYQTANKIFSLNYKIPAGIMIYHNSNLMGIPWEVLIKEYREEIHKELPELRDYWYSIKEYLDHLPANVFQDYYVQQFRSLKHDLASKLSSPNEITNRENFFESVERNIGNLPELAAPFDAKVLSDWQALSATVFEDSTFNEFKEQPTKDEFLKITSLLANHLLPGGETGLVLAGYGAKQFFPEVLTVLIEGIFNGCLRYSFETNKSSKITQDHSAGIITFAQSDVAENIIEGIDNEHVMQVYNLFSNSLHEFVDQLDIASNIRSISHHAADKFSQNFWNEWKNFRDKVYVSPVLGAVDCLSKDQLAIMAETLVELTAFKRRFAMKTEETVGGPIDVAVISKGDGLIWIKRKHYFDPKLNLHFASKYYGEKP